MKPKPAPKVVVPEGVEPEQPTGLKTPIPLPPPNWERILQFTVWGAIILSIICFISRIKTFVILSEALDAILLPAIVVTALVIWATKTRRGR